MKKILLIAKREFLIRIKNRKFWLMTLLGPILLAVFIVVVGFIFSYSGDEEKQVVILDEADLFGGALKDQSNFYFTFSNEDLETLRNDKNPDFDGILYIPADEDLDQSEVTVNFY